MKRIIGLTIALSVVLMIVPSPTADAHEKTEPVCETETETYYTWTTKYRWVKRTTCIFRGIFGGCLWKHTWWKRESYRAHVKRTRDVERCHDVAVSHTHRACLTTSRRGITINLGNTDSDAECERRERNWRERNENAPYPPMDRLGPANSEGVRTWILGRSPTWPPDAIRCEPYGCEPEPVRNICDFGRASPPECGIVPPAVPGFPN